MSTIRVRLEERHLTDGQPNYCWECAWALAVCDALHIPWMGQKRIQVERSRTVDEDNKEVAEHPAWVREFIRAYDNEGYTGEFVGMEADLEFRPLVDPPALEVIQGDKP